MGYLVFEWDIFVKIHNRLKRDIVEPYSTLNVILMELKAKLSSAYHRVVPFEYRPNYGHTFRKYFGFLEKSQWWSKEQLIEYQNKQLNSIITHAYETVPYYQKILNVKRTCKKYRYLRRKMFAKTSIKRPNLKVYSG